MSNSILVVTWGTGKMILDMGAFFPCSQNKLKKLLRIVREDREHSDELYNQIIEYQKSQIENIRAELEADENNSKATTSLKRWEGLMNTTKKFRR